MRIALGGFAAASLGVSLVWADSGEVWSPERLIPEDGREIKSDLSIRGQGDDDVWSSVVFGRTPIFQDEDGSYLLFDGRGTISHFWDQENTLYQGSAGLIYRTPLSLDSAFGVNGFVDFGDLEGFAGQSGVGFELEHLPDEAIGLRLGGNAYIPFKDYTQDRNRSRAPLMGADLYLGLARQWTEHRLEGFLTGFYYDGNKRVHDLWGVVGEVEYRYEDLEILPEGSHFYARLGGRYDSKENGLSPLFGIGFSVSLNPNSTRLDRVADVRRNLAFGSAFVPLDWKQAAGLGGPNFGCGPGNSPFAESFSSSVQVADGSGMSYVAPPGTTLLEIVGLAPIEEACTIEIGGGEGAPPDEIRLYQDCVAALSGITDNGSGGPLSVNLGSAVGVEKPAGSCEFTQVPITGG